MTELIQGTAVIWIGIAICFSQYGYCRRPVIVTDQNILLGTVISRLKVHPTSTENDVIDTDMILVRGAEKRVITGADILGRLLRGIAIRETVRMRRA